MRLLLDTHILLWVLQEPERLSSRHRAAVEDLSNTLYFSSASILEIAIKVAAGKLRVPDRLQQKLEGLGCQQLAVNADHAWKVASLPLIHRDPFDRLIVAQAIFENLTLVTVDRKMPEYGVGTFI